MAKRTHALHKLNQFGLSHPGMIIMALRNADCTLQKPTDLTDKALTIKDIYCFLRTHVRPFRAFTDEEWSYSAKALRHALAQTSYFCRVNSKLSTVVPPNGVGERGSLWTMATDEDDTVEAVNARIAKTVRQKCLQELRKNLVNPALVDALVSGEHGWRDAEGKALPTSDARRRVAEHFRRQRQLAFQQHHSAVPAMTPVYSIPTTVSVQHLQMYPPSYGIGPPMMNNTDNAQYRNVEH